MKNFFITTLEGLCTLCEFIMNLLGLLFAFSIGMFMLWGVVEITNEPYVEDNTESQRWVYPCVSAIMADSNERIDWDTAQKECINQGPPEWFLKEW